MKNKRLEKIAEEIFELERNIDFGKDPEISKVKIEKLMDQLSFNEVIELDMIISEIEENKN